MKDRWIVKKHHTLEKDGLTYTAWEQIYESDDLCPIVSDAIHRMCRDWKSGVRVAWEYSDGSA